MDILLNLKVSIDNEIFELFCEKLIWAISLENVNMSLLIPEKISGLILGKSTCDHLKFWIIQGIKNNIQNSNFGLIYLKKI